MHRGMGRGLRLTRNWLQTCWLDQRKRILVTLETILFQVGEDDVGGQREREGAEFGLGTAEDPRLGLKPWCSGMESTLAECVCGGCTLAVISLNKAPLVTTFSRDMWRDI